MKTSGKPLRIHGLMFRLVYSGLMCFIFKFGNQYGHSFFGKKSVFLPFTFGPKKKTIFSWTLKFWRCTFDRKKRVNYDKFEIATNCVNQKFKLNAFFVFILTGPTWYYTTIYLVITYFASFTDYLDDIFEVISNLHVHGNKFGVKINKFGGKSILKKYLKKYSTEFMEFVFSRSVYIIWEWPHFVRPATTCKDSLIQP